MKETGYSIKDLEVLSGIKMHTIRIWEKRYELLQPERTDTNIRTYDDHNLKRLLNVSLLTRNGYKISKVASWDEDQIRKMVLDITKNKTSDSDYIERFLILMVELDTVGMENLLDEIVEKYDFEEACFNIFFQLFERVGLYWQVGTVFPAQEHFVTNLFRQKLIAAIDQIKIPSSDRPSILFFLPENELHEMSLLFYSFLARKGGFRSYYLGQSVPFDDLIKISSIKKIDYVFTAFVNSILKEDLESYLVRLKEVFQKQKIFITGHQVQEHEPALPRNVKTMKNFHEFKKYLG